MRNIFKTIQAKAVKVMEPVKTNDQLVDEIHTAFLTEVDRLLQQAKILLPTNTDTELILKAKRLKELGFTSTAEVSKANVAEQKKYEIEKENKKKDELVRAITYFSINYSLYKFITQESVNAICEKYGLVYGEIARYKGTVPDKNLAEIEQFKVKDDDECYVESLIYKDTKTVLRQMYLTKYRHDRIIARKASDNDSLASSMFLTKSSETVNMKCPLEIAAPIKDFNMNGMEVKDYKLTAKIQPVLDPVVLKPVIFGSTKYYLIVTAWGKEAEDDIVVNPKHQ
jgi:hypothetical protein